LVQSHHTVKVEEYALAFTVMTNFNININHCIMENKRYPLPPFNMETALQKVQAAEDAWNTRDPEKVCLAYTIDTEWRNRTDFINGREEVKQFLTRKWEKELDYKLKKELWGFRENRMAVRFEYEWHDHTGQWFRSYGNELWEFDENGYMQKRFASINDMPIAESDRKLF
jgi:nuclear transport factor 2 (NTF2) superfamily protein